MSTDIAESLPKRKFAPAPMIAKGAKGKGPAPKGGGKKEAPKGKSGGGKEKGASEEGSEKRIRQAVYDICLLYTSPSPRDKRQSRMPSSA